MKALGGLFLLGSMLLWSGAAIILIWRGQEPTAQAAIQPDIAANSLTHSVWRSENGKIEDECESVGWPTPRGRGVIVMCIVSYKSGGRDYQANNAVQAPLYIEASVTVYPFSSVDINRSTGTVKISSRPTITVGE